MRLIDADAVKRSIWREWLCSKTTKEKELYDILEKIIDRCCEHIDNAPTVDAVPINELIKLRDWFYESDSITMGGLRSLNELIAKYSSDQLPRIENGFERR